MENKRMDQRITVWSWKHRQSSFSIGKVCSWMTDNWLIAAKKCNTDSTTIIDFLTDWSTVVLRLVTLVKDECHRSATVVLVPSKRSRWVIIATVALVGQCCLLRSFHSFICMVCGCEVGTDTDQKSRAQMTLQASARGAHGQRTERSNTIRSRPRDYGRGNDLLCPSD